MTFIHIRFLYDDTEDTKVRPVLTHIFSVRINARDTALFQFAMLVQSSVYTFLKERKTAVEINDN
jgi:hypothetical protein